MAATIESSFISQFSDNLYSLLEQKGSKMRTAVKVEMAHGEKHFFDRLGSFAATEITSRLQPTELQDPAHSRRMATVRRYTAGTYLDDIDKLKMLIDPTSDYAIKLARAQGRNLDDVIYAAALGSAATGKDGAGSAAFDSNQVVLAEATGFTVAKFNAGLTKLEANEVDVDSVRLFLALNAAGVEDLLNDPSNKITSFDFQDSKVLAHGGLPSFRGVNIIRTQNVPHVTQGTEFRALLLTEDSIKVAMNKDIEVKTSERPDLNCVLQILTFMQYGAVRMDEQTIVDIHFV